MVRAMWAKAAGQFSRALVVFHWAADSVIKGLHYVARGLRFLLHLLWQHRRIAITIAFLALSVLSWSTDVFVNHTLALRVLAPYYRPALEAYGKLTSSPPGISDSRETKFETDEWSRKDFFDEQETLQGVGDGLHRSEQPGQGYVVHVPLEEHEDEAERSEATLLGIGSAQESADAFYEYEGETQTQSDQTQLETEPEVDIECPCARPHVPSVHRDEEGFDALLRLVRKHGALGAYVVQERRLKAKSISTTVVESKEPQTSSSEAEYFAPGWWTSYRPRYQEEETQSGPVSIFSFYYTSPVGALRVVQAGEKRELLRQVGAICWSPSSPGIAAFTQGFPAILTSLSLCLRSGQVLVALFPAPIDREIEEFFLLRPMVYTKGAISSILLAVAIAPSFGVLRRYLRWRKTGERDRSQ